MSRWTWRVCRWTGLAPRRSADPYFRRLAVLRDEGHPAALDIGRDLDRPAHRADVVCGAGVGGIEGPSERPFDRRTGSRPRIVTASRSPPGDVRSRRPGPRDRDEYGLVGGDDPVVV